MHVAGESRPYRVPTPACQTIARTPTKLPLTLGPRRPATWATTVCARQAVSPGRRRGRRLADELPKRAGALSARRRALGASACSQNPPLILPYPGLHRSKRRRALKTQRTSHPTQACTAANALRPCCASASTGSSAESSDSSATRDAAATAPASAACASTNAASSAPVRDITASDPSVPARAPAGSACTLRARADAAREAASGNRVQLAEVHPSLTLNFSTLKCIYHHTRTAQQAGECITGGKKHVPSDKRSPRSSPLTKSAARLSSAVPREHSIECDIPHAAARQEEGAAHGRTAALSSS